MRTIARLGALFALSLCVSYASATTWYVSTTGSDSNPCTSGSPCATPDHAFNAVATPGDTVQVAAGTYSYGAGSMHLSNSGTSGNYITLTCATRGACLITSSTGGNTTVVNITGTYTTFDGFEVTDTNSSGNNLGIYIAPPINTGFVSVTRNTVHHIEGDCSGSGGAGIEVAGSGGSNYALANIVIDSNLVYDITYTSGCAEGVVQFDGILDENNGNNNSVTNNIVYHTGGGWGIAVGNGSFPGGTWTGDVLSNNLVFSTLRGGIIYGAYAGLIVTNNVVLNNGTLYPDGCGFMQAPTTYTQVVNHNDVYGNGGGTYCTNFSTGGSGFQIGDISVNPALGTTFVNWQANGSGDYHEISGSPTIGAGTATGAPTTDYAGNFRLAPFDMGAYQATSWWYVRTDGGTATQCTGHTNAAYPGSGTAQDCALKHPFWLMQTGVGTPTWRTDFVGGDTVQFEDAGPYYIGQGNNGVGTDWASLGFNHCAGGGAVDTCEFPVTPPLGEAIQHTKWLGYCVALGTGCHQSDGSNLKNPTVFKAAAGPFYMFSVQGAQWFDIQGFDITQPDSCTSAGGGGTVITSTAKTGTVATYGWTFSYSNGNPLAGEWVNIDSTTNGGGIFNGLKQIATVSGAFFTVNGFSSGTIATQAESGAGMHPAGNCTASNNFANHGVQIAYLTAQGPSNTTLTDIGVHGMVAQGVLGSHINQAPGDFFTGSYIFIRGNGQAGWDSDGGGCGTSCETVGTMTLDHLRVEFNGCVPVNTSSAPDPTTGTDAAGYQYCWAQSTGGYGDGLSFIAAGDVTFNATNSFARWNTQDGFDLLHLGDDQTHTQTLNVKNDWSEGNMGQTFKIGGAANATAWDNFSDSNCHVMPIGTAFPMTLNPSGFNAGLQSDSCRAGGDEWLVALNNGRTVQMIHNTSVGYGDTMYDVICAGTCSGTEVFKFQDNISKGYGNPWNSGTLPGGLFINGTEDPFPNTGSAASNNLWNTMRGGTCPQNGHETSTVCSDPLLVAESSVDAIDPHLTSSSPARAAGVAAGPTSDYAGIAFLSPPAIGMFEFGSSPQCAAPTFSPVTGTYTSAQTVSIGTTTTSPTIYYTRDGSTPTTGSTVYSAPYTVSVTETDKAICTASGFATSGAGSASYTITSPATPQVTMRNITVSGAVTIK